VGTNAGEILQRGVPRQQRDVLAAMLVYVMEQHRDDVGPVAAALAKIHEASDVVLLDAACGILIDVGDADGAARLWTAAGHSPAGGVWNGSFASRPAAGGFDWRLDSLPGVAQVYLDGRGLRVELSGRQAETARLLSQVVLLDPNRRYKLEWSTRTNGMPEITGLVWTLGSQRYPVAASVDEKKDSTAIVAAKRLTPLELWYQRPSGQVRAEGWVEIREVSLTPLP
jgi:hypothetical protein